MHDFCKPIAVCDIKVGQLILIKCCRINQIFRTDNQHIIGSVTAVFDAGNPTGIQIDVSNKTQWWRWIPALDGGEAFVK